MSIYTQYRAAFSLGENFRRKRLFLMLLDDFFFTIFIITHAYKESNGKFLNNKKEETNLVFLLFQYVVQYDFAESNQDDKSA